MANGLYPLYEAALEALDELISHNSDLNFGHELPIQLSSLLSIPDAANPGSTLPLTTKSTIMLEIYERQFSEPRESNAITPLHKSIINLQQDIAIFLVEIENFYESLVNLPQHYYLPDTLRKMLYHERNKSRPRESDINVISKDSFLSFLMSKIIGDNEIEMLRKLGNDRILKKFAKVDHKVSRSRYEFLSERHHLNSLLSDSLDNKRRPNFYRLAQYFADL